MARLPLTLEDPNYHDMFERFAFDVAAELADTLIGNKVGKEVAHETVVTFLFGFAMMFDEGGSYKTAGKYRPLLGFSNGLGQLIVPTSETYLHELAYDIVERVYNVEGRR